MVFLLTLKLKEELIIRNSWTRGYIGQNTLITQASYGEGSYATENNEFAARLNYDTK